ncbi:hypothetical protein [Leadbetterella sp. DM7]|uniref:hypothetical protein n=1 Tax=Leadbetterella sp. DM7 TaxID=3235085 RepID=UPI00349E524A
MRSLAIGILCWLSFGVQAQEVARLRKEFVAASASEAGAEKFLRTTEKISASSKPLLQAYRGAALLIGGKYAKKIEDKKKLAREGIHMLEWAVAKDPDHVEIRTLRLSIQENSPKILKYKDKIEEDRAFVTRHFEGLPEGELKDFVGGYLRNSEK